MTRKCATVMFEDMGCHGRSAHSVEEALRKVPGVSRASVNPATEVAYVEYDAERCTEADLVIAVESVGVRTIRSVARLHPDRISHSAALYTADTTNRSRFWWMFAWVLAIAALP